MQKESKSEALLKGKCPRCRKGDMFPYSALSLTKFMKMNEDCPVCGLHFEREPGFFVGAMYVNYAFSVAIFIAVGATLFTLGDFEFYVYLLTITAIVVLLLPFLFRYSRILFLHFFGGVRYDSKYSN